MKIYLNAGFGSPIGPSDLAWIKSLGYDGIRQDIHHSTQGSLAAEIHDAGLSMILILDPATWTPPDSASLPSLVRSVLDSTNGTPVVFEIGNELDGVMDPEIYARAFNWAWQSIMMAAPSSTVLTAGIRNTGIDPVSWLKRVLSTGLVPPDPSIGLGYHTYRATPPGVPVEGYDTREQEFSTLRWIANGRPLWNTEIGWSTATRKKKGCSGWFGGTWHYTDDQVASFLSYELQVNRDQGALSTVVFQLNDGPNDENEHRFGIRDYLLNPKPSSLVVLSHKESNA